MMFHPSFEMENGKNINASTVHGSLMKPLDEIERGGSHDDIMNRRQKNRERQRRYRARKRLEVDTNKSCIINQSTPPQVEILANSTLNDIVTRVHCQRDWKKDARRAYAFKEQEVKSNGPVIPDLISASGSQAGLPSGVHAQRLLESEIYSRSSSILDNIETHRSAHSRRNWKAEARNKKR